MEKSAPAVKERANSPPTFRKTVSRVKMCSAGVYLSPVPAQRATFFDALSLLSWSFEQAANNVRIFGEKLWRTPTERASTLTIIRAANESSSNVITFWNAP